MSIEMGIITECIKAARRKNEISQTKMAKKMKCSQPYYSSMEIGIKNLDCLKLSTVARITRSSFLITGKTFLLIDTKNTDVIGKKLSKSKDGLVVTRFPLQWADLHEIAKFTKMSFWISKKGIALLNPMQTNAAVKKACK